MASHPAAFLYTPTPIEEAYAFYVYDALFAPIFGSFPADRSLNLDAKNTLKILERSEVDRIILATIWSVADPEGVKCLTDIAQLHVVLRLIALAQDGLLEKEINRAFNQERNKTTPVTVFKKTLWMSLEYEDCPLPSFKGVAMPTQEFLETLSNRLQGIHKTSAPAPAPVPIPISHTPARHPAPVQKARSPSHPTTKLKEPRKELQPYPTPIPNVINIKKMSSQSPTGLQSAIQQIETLGVDSPNPKVKNLKELDPENFELLQEQAALQSAIMESNIAKPAATKVAKPEREYGSFSKDQVLSEEEALQKAIYESTNAASSPKPAKSVAAAPKKEEHKNWLRMSSLQDSVTEYDKDVDSDEEYKRKKAPKGAAAYADYLASLDPSIVPLDTPTKSPPDESQNSDEFDKKPPAKVRPAPTKTPDKHLPSKNDKGKLPPASNGDDRVDEYPQAVQELVMNGFELEKAIQGYKMLGDNFDDIVLFLTSTMTVKELVINGFNIHTVQKAYELVGDNMDDLLAYLMTNAT